MSELKYEISIIRELSKRYMEIALSDRHIKMRQRFRDSNDLKIVRPPLIIEEIPWQQMNIDGELDCVCENEELRNMEFELRTALFREKYFRCDNYIEPVWSVNKKFTSTGIGLKGSEQIIAGKHTDIKSHSFEDVLADESALEAFRMPVITAYPEEDAENLARAQEILGDIMPVRLRGHYLTHAPWDDITRLRGVEPILYDLYDRPEYMHRLIRLFTEAKSTEMDQMEALGLYDTHLQSLHCTPNEVTLPDPSDDGVTRCRDMWFRTTAQMFSSISPEDHYEFDMQYSIPLAERCAYTYYGCCEPLHDRIDQLKRYKNLRKIGVSPWADVERSAEQTRGQYVLSRKPNPAYVATVTDPEVIRREISETAKACLKYDCPCDITLKDISTVSDRPENLILWAKTASEVLDEYYGAE